MRHVAEIESHLQEIWSNWREDSGNCEDCVGRDCNGGWAPVYGHGDPSADVILLGRDPGGNKDRFEKFDHRNADNKDYPEPMWAEWPEEFSQRTSDDVYLIRSASKGETFLKNLDCYEKDPSGEPHGLYYTNLKKCDEIKNFDESEAYESCKSYLDTEFDLIDPSVVVTFKPEPLKWALNYYDIECDDIGKPTDIALTNSWSSDGVTILPSVHFSMLNSYVRYTIADDAEDYWRRLAKQVNEVN